MIENENYMQKEIDKKILAELRKNLKIQKENVDMLNQNETEKIFQKIEDKLEAIFSLFQGDFSFNERIIEERLPKNKENSNLYDKVANNVISHRIEKLFDKIIYSGSEDCRLVSICADRQFFIQKVISQNITADFINDCIKKNKVSTLSSVCENEQEK